jgi:hypothetical protein
MSRNFTHFRAGLARQLHKMMRSTTTKKPSNTRLRLEPLSDRIVPTVFQVNSLADLSLSPGVNNATGQITGTHTVTLRSAIEAANATPGNNTIRLTLAGTYRITIPPVAPDDTPATENNHAGDFDIIPNAASPAGSSLTIMNTSGGAVTVSGNHLDRVFDINPLVASSPAQFTVALQGFTITNGNASPGDSAAGSGGGIRDQGNVNLTLKHMVIIRNNATADGGGVVMFDTVEGSWTLTITNCVINNNHAGDAGGGIDTDGTGTVVITNSLVNSNTDINQGAGIYIDVATGSPLPSGANMTLTNSVVNNNTALATGITSSGGGISNAGNGTMTITNCTIANNFSGANGGGFSDENDTGTLIVSNCFFLNNSATGDGGGIQEGGPSTLITNTEFNGNSSGGAGGALFVNGTTMVLASSTFVDNTSSGDGGAIEVETTGTGAAGSTITNTTIAGNQAVNNGGANGGGIDAVGIGTLALQNDTINANFASNGGGVFWDGGGTFSARNTIIAGNADAFGGAGPDANNPSGNFTDNGGNLIGVSKLGSGNSGFSAGSTQTGTVASPLDPLLGPLQFNGGPMVGAPGAGIHLRTEAPLRGSPAIGMGILMGAPTVDERGLPSVIGGKINIGAVS